MSKSKNENKTILSTNLWYNTYKYIYSEHMRKIGGQIVWINIKY